ncbi:hypothetical protein GCM10011492_04670 [Flexivirga endophytica]|uniref:Uncharacterized protein n=1 Tax=Flexivirga endophytica TaxID=1849103 RepID=A0A916SWU4_9MICO|nr:hypothetical protein GCM10011492_04670 [Flexivirga endophytica]GHB37731.1 hypothetical protein GCM10008112_02940 [Flexivirga endophytica]
MQTLAGSAETDEGGAAETVGTPVSVGTGSSVLWSVPSPVDGAVGTPVSLDVATFADDAGACTEGALSLQPARAPASSTAGAAPKAILRNAVVVMIPLYLS